MIGGHPLRFNSLLKVFVLYLTLANAILFHLNHLYAETSKVNINLSTEYMFGTLLKWYKFENAKWS